MKIKRDQVTGLVLVLIGIVLAILTSQFNKPMTWEYPGPKLMPAIAEFGFIVCGAGVFVKGCLQKEPDQKGIEAAGLIRMLVTFIILCLYILAMKYVGFIAATPFMLLATTEYFLKSSGVKAKLWVVVVFSIVVTLVIYGMYVPLFGMTLPEGLLFE